MLHKQPETQLAEWVSTAETYFSNSQKLAPEKQSKFHQLRHTGRFRAWKIGGDNARKGIAPEIPNNNGSTGTWPSPPKNFLEVAKILQACVEAVTFVASDKIKLFPSNCESLERKGRKFT